MEKVQVFLVDDHPIIRQGMRSFLESEPGIQIKGEAGEGLEAIREIERLKPDVCIVDIVMPGLNGLEITRQIKKRCAQIKVIILSMHADETYVTQAIKAGADGYVLKSSAPDTLLTAIHQAYHGERYLCPELAERAVQAYFEKAQEGSRENYEILSTREREVLLLAAEGLTNVEIGERLSISSRTVEVHRRNMMRKLQLRNQRDLIRYAIHKGLLLLEK